MYGTFRNRQGNEMTPTVLLKGGRASEQNGK